MTTYEFRHSEETTATPEAVWALWSDVTTWTSWDTGLDHAELNGTFTRGSSGTMRIPDQPPITFTLTEVTPCKSFTDETHIPGAVLHFHHTLEPLANGNTRVTHSVTIEGPKAQEIGPFVTSDLPEAVEALVKLASSAP
jgi:polyketide cyclase/dehydrase/lipid transport protein